MFAPSQADVRRFFCAAHAKTRAGEPLEALETLAGQWIAEHPEYHPDLADVDAALVREYTGEAGQTNPFLHLSMHLSISEQCSIDQPRGIRQAVELLAARRGSLHDGPPRSHGMPGPDALGKPALGPPAGRPGLHRRVQRRATKD
jgi:hypothetical protein